MVITTPHVVKSFLDLKPFNRLFPLTASDLTIRVSERGVKESFINHFKDIDVMRKRVTIGRTSSNVIQIADRNVSRLHAIIECDAKDGTWIFKDVNSLNGSTVNGKKLKPNTPHILKNEDKIWIGKQRYHLCHEMFITLHYLIDDIPKIEKPPHPRKLTWRRSLYCNGCMGFGPRHSCTMRVSILQKMILDANRKSNVYAVRPGKTLLQKAVMKRTSFWWPKKEGEEDEVEEKLEVPTRYESDVGKLVQGLPDFDDEEPPSPVQYPVFHSSLTI